MASPPGDKRQIWQVFDDRTNTLTFKFLSLFQNPVGFETSSWKNRQKPGFSSKSKEAVSKAEVLEQPPLIMKNPGASSGV
jgi:hypothetical protein